MHVYRNPRRNNKLLRRSRLAAVFVLVVAGSFYRDQALRLKFIIENPVELSVPLKTLPFTIDDWVGQDVAIPDHIQRVAGNDDFVNRFYVNESSNQWANVYVAYSSHPRTMVGHKPEVCYVGGGWVHDDSVQSQFLCSSGRAIPCLIHRFHKPAPRHEEIVVLNFYVVNGRIVCSEDGFSGLSWRMPNIAGDPARYVAQVQISSVLENSVRKAASDITNSILEFLPGIKGEFGQSDAETQLKIF